MASIIRIYGAAALDRFSGRTEKKFPQPLTAHQLWKISLSAILSERNSDSHFRLHPNKRLGKRLDRISLKSSWDINSRETLLASLHELATEGHRVHFADVVGHPPLAWDIGRYVNNTRAGLAAGYIDEETAWRLLHEITGQTADFYQSWAEFAEDFVAGRQIWLANASPDIDEGYRRAHEPTIAAAKRLLNPQNRNSPWQVVPWDVIYRPDFDLPQNSGGASQNLRIW